MGFFNDSKLLDYIEERLLFQKISKTKHHPCWPRAPAWTIAQNGTVQLFVGFVMQGHIMAGILEG